MAWRSSGGSHRELIENLFKNGLIKDQRIKEAMLSVDRADFTNQKSDAYDDRPQSSNSLKIKSRIFILFSSLVGYAVSRNVYS
jgi:protein-L-isoaspartate O-methyltransferase